jgi:hypothetical protein
MLSSAATKRFVFGLVRRKLALASVAGALMFVSVYAFAASLNVSSQTLGAGNSVVASCIPSPANSVTISYQTTYDSTIPGYRVSQVTINGVLPACANKNVAVTLTNASNVSLGEVTTTLGASPPSSVAIAVPASGAPFPVSAANVTGVHVVIAG